jgi:hypothetical protein
LTDANGVAVGLPLRIEYDVLQSYRVPTPQPKVFIEDASFMFTVDGVKPFFVNGPNFFNNL